MSLFAQLRAEYRHRRYRRRVHRDIERAQREVERRMRPANPGYDELKDPLFIGVMVLAVVVVVADDLKNFNAAPLLAWLIEAATAIGSWA